MISVLIFLKKLGIFFRKLTVGSISTALAVIIYGTFSEYYLERGIPQSGIHSLFSSLWWTMQTLTTVGYGDTPVFGVLGRINAIFIMVIGIGSLGLFLASMSATLTNMRLKRRIGMMRVRMKEHVIVCNYDSGKKEIVKAIVNRGSKVVAVSENEIPNDDSGFGFVKGSCLDDDTLVMAGIEHSDSVIILADQDSGPMQDAKTDAMTVMMAMKVKSKNPGTNVIAEVLLPKSVSHAENAGVDEPIVRGSLSMALISKSIFFPGLSKALAGIMSDSNDVEIGEADGNEYSGMEYGQILDAFNSEGKFIIGLRKNKRILTGMNRSTEVQCDGILYITRRNV